MRHSFEKRRACLSRLWAAALYVVLGAAVAHSIPAWAQAPAQRLYVVVEPPEGPAVEQYLWVIEEVSEHLRARVFALDLPRLLVREGNDSLAEADLIVQFRIIVRPQGVKVTADLLDVPRAESVLRLPSIAPHGSAQAIVSKIDPEIFPNLTLHLMTLLKVPDRPMMLADCIFAPHVDDPNMRNFAFAVGANYGAELMLTSLPSRFEIMTLNMARYERWCHQLSDRRVLAQKTFDAAFYGFLEDANGPWLTLWFRQGNRTPSKLIQLNSDDLDASLKAIANEAEALANAP